MQRSSSKKDSLTLTKLKKYRGLESLTNDQAAEAISSLERLSILLFQTYKNAEIDKHEK
jgi:hypothetical protein